MQKLDKDYQSLDNNRLALIFSSLQSAWKCLKENQIVDAFYKLENFLLDPSLRPIPVKSMEEILALLKRLAQESRTSQLNLGQYEGEPLSPEDEKRSFELRLNALWVELINTIFPKYDPEYQAQWHMEIATLFMPATEFNFWHLSRAHRLRLDTIADEKVKETLKNYVGSWEQQQLIRYINRLINSLPSGKAKKNYEYHWINHSFEVFAAYWHTYRSCLEPEVIRAFIPLLQLYVNQLGLRFKLFVNRITDPDLEAEVFDEDTLESLLEEAQKTVVLLDQTERWIANAFKDLSKPNFVSQIQHNFSHQFCNHTSLTDKQKEFIRTKRLQIVNLQNPETPNTVDALPSLAHFIQEHQKHLENLRQNFLASPITFKSQKDFQQQILALLQEALSFITARLGPAPGLHEIALMGSYARIEMGAYSDLDILIFVEHDDLRFHPYYSLLISYFHLYLIGLGEKGVYHLVNHRIQIKTLGLYLDEGDVARIQFFPDAKEEDFDLAAQKEWWQAPLNPDNHHFALIGTPETLAQQSAYWLKEARDRPDDEFEKAQVQIQLACTTLSLVSLFHIKQQPNNFIQQYHKALLVQCASEKKLDSNDIALVFLKCLRINFQRKLPWQTLKNYLTAFSLCRWGLSFVNSSILEGLRFGALTEDEKQHRLSLMVSSGFAIAYNEAYQTFLRIRHRYERIESQHDCPLTSLNKKEEEDIQHRSTLLIKPLQDFFQFIIEYSADKNKIPQLWSVARDKWHKEIMPKFFEHSWPKGAQPLLTHQQMALFLLNYEKNIYVCADTLEECEIETSIYAPLVRSLRYIGLLHNPRLLENENNISFLASMLSPSAFMRIQILLQTLQQHQNLKKVSIPEFLAQIQRLMDVLHAVPFIFRHAMEASWANNGVLMALEEWAFNETLFDLTIDIRNSASRLRQRNNPYHVPEDLSTFEWIAPTWVRPKTFSEPFAFRYLPHKRLLKSHFQAQLLENNGSLKRQTMINQEKRLVVALKEDQTILAYVKFFPELPGTQVAVDSLTKRLSGKAHITTLVKLTHPQQEHAYPILCSKPQGKTLDKYSDLKILENKLDHEAFTWKVFENLLIAPENESDTHLVFQSGPNNTLVSSGTLLSINSEQAFEEPIIQEASVLNKEKVQMKTLVYCFQEMFKPPHEKVIQSFLKIDFFVLLKNWLEDLKALSQAWICSENRIGLFTTKEVLAYTQNSEQFCYLPIVFVPTTTSSLYQQSLRLQALFKQEVFLRSNLLQVVHSLILELAPYYEAVLKNPTYPDAKARFNAILSDYQRKQAETLPHQQPSLAKLSKHQRPNLREAIAHNNIDDPQKALEDITKGLQLGQQIEEILLDYETIKNPKEQAHIIWERISKLLKLGKKVGIIFSSNNIQATKIYQSYYDNNLKNIINDSAKNQAKAFQIILEEKINKLENNEQVHVLPIATSLEGGNNVGKNAIDEKIILRDLQNIKNHLDEGWHVLVLVNPNHLLNKKDGTQQKYQIGGGSSSQFYLPSKQIVFDKKILSQGLFVETFIDLFFNIYAKNTDINNSIEKLRTKLINPGVVIHPLLYYVREALIRQNVITSRSSIKTVYFSPSYNVRIDCSNEATAKDVALMLSAYGAGDLNTIRRRQLRIGAQFREIPTQKLIVSIEAVESFGFLKHYCKIPLDVLRLHYARALAQSQDYKEVIIEPDVIHIDNKKLNFEDCLVQKKFGEPKIKPLDRLKLHPGILHPEAIRYPIRHIMKDLSQDQHHLLQPEFVTVYKPLIRGMDNPTFEYRDFATFTAHISDLSVKKNKIDKNSKFNAIFQTSIIYHYNSFIFIACQLYNKYTIEDIFDENSSINKEILSYSNKLQNFIKNDISSTVNTNIQLFKYWLYVQVAILSYAKGNTYITNNILTALNDFKDLLVYFPTTFVKIYQLLTSEIAEPRFIIEMATYYTHHFGICLPNLDAYKKLMKEEFISEEKRKKFIEKHLFPVLSYNNIYNEEVKESDFSKTLIKLIEETSDQPLINNEKPNVIQKKTREQIKYQKKFEKFTDYLEKYSLYYVIVETVKELSHILHEEISFKDTAADFLNILKLHGNIFSADKNLLLTAIEEGNENIFESILKFNLAKVDFNFYKNICDAIYKIKDTDFLEKIWHLFNKYIIQLSMRFDKKTAISKLRFNLDTKNKLETRQHTKDYTVINNKFELIHEMEQINIEEFYKQTAILLNFPNKENQIKSKLDKGSFGELGIARDITTGEYIGVKKIKGNDKIKDALREAEIQKLLKDCSHIMPLIDSAICTDEENNEDVLYQFMPLAGFGNGLLLIETLSLINPLEKEILLTYIARELLFGISQMHEKRIYHLNIKPENFVLDMSSQLYIINLDRARKFSPEDSMQYNAEAADLKAIGSTLLMLYDGQDPFKSASFTDPNNNNANPTSSFDPNNNNVNPTSSFDLKNTEQPPLLSFIAKLLVSEPNKHLTIQAALDDPLFKMVNFPSKHILKEKFKFLKSLAFTNPNKVEDIEVAKINQENQVNQIFSQTQSIMQNTNIFQSPPIQQQLEQTPHQELEKEHKDLPALVK